LGRANFNRTSFLGGELSPKILGRVDVPQYQHGCEELTNFIINPQGGAKRRPGTRFYEDITANGNLSSVVLIPWIIDQDSEEVYLFYFTLLATGSSVVGINTIDGTSLTHGSGLTISGGASGLDYVNITNIREIQWTIADDLLIIVHRDRPPIFIRRDDKNDFAIFDWSSIHSVINSGDTNTYQSVPYEEYNPESNKDNTLQLNVDGDTAPGGTLDVSYSVGDELELVADDGSGGGTHIPFSSDDVGSFWKLANGIPEVTIVEVDTVAGDNLSCGVTVRFVSNSLTAKTGIWAPQSWGGKIRSGVTPPKRGWPRTVAYHESRLVFGGCTGSPDTVWASRAFNVSKLSEEPLVASGDDDAKDFSLAAVGGNGIQWLSSGRFLSMGTVTDEFTVRDINLPIPFVQQEATSGSFPATPARIGSSILYTKRGGHSINEFVFDFDTDSFIPQDVMFVAEHMTDKKKIELDEARVSSTTLLNKSTIKKMLFIGGEDLLCILDSRGGLTTLIRNHAQKIGAFSYQQLGGSSDFWTAFLAEGSQNSVSPTIMDMCALVGGSGKDQLWMLVHRTIDGSSAFYLEYIEFTEDFHQNYLEAFHVDSGVYDAAPTVVPGDTFTGLSHLEDEEVQIFDIDTGRLRAPQTVAGGSITLTDGDISRAHIGIGFTSRLKPVKLEAGSVIGSAQATIKRIDEVTVRIYNSRGMKVGTANEEILDNQVFEDVSIAPDQKQPVFTGDKTIKFDQGYDRDGQLIIESYGPLPLEVLSLITRYQVNEV